MTRDVLIEVRNVTKKYHLAEEEIWALRGISLDIFSGEFLSIMGPSGSGKSTLFNQIGALDVPDDGSVLFAGQSIFDMPEESQAAFRCTKLGYIFQTFNLIPVMSALQNVSLPGILRGDAPALAETRAKEILQRVGLGHRLNHKPFELSGGQQQRVAVARALVNKPDVILADEPTGNLDTKTGQEIINLLCELNREEKVTVICSTHDPKMLKSSERICWIRDGMLEEISTADEMKKQ
ncbi:MAG: putative transport system ATP-binding protein [Candidatus Sumerlaeota bacterium]|nr:putative transport system ATP-binding protein [Candidatus Sumerlaeota bacterium]